MNCFICDNSSEGDFTNNHEPTYNCSTCGNYSITDIAMNTIPKQTYPNWKAILQKHISNNKDFGVVAITTDTIKTLYGY